MGNRPPAMGMSPEFDPAVRAQMGAAADASKAPAALSPAEAYWADKSGAAPAAYEPTAADYFGWALFLVGLCLIAWGFIMDPGIDVAGEYGLTSRVNNTGLLNTKLMLVITGAACLVSGSVFSVRRR